MGHPSSRVLVAVVIGLLSVSPSWARVGVTSVVDGQPKGLPPAGTERVLHVGNDMQANERVTTGANDKAHIVFLDGTSLTVGPNSVLTIDRFVYDPARKTGELALNASRGVFRLVGGAISKTSEIKVKTPSATMGIRGGIATFSVTATGATTANFLFGGSLTVTSQGITRTTTQPGSQIVAPVGAPPTPPATIPPGGLGIANAFQNSGGAQQAGGPGAAPPGGGGARLSSASIGAAFAGSGLSRANSAMPPAAALAAIPATQQAQLKVAAVPLATAGVLAAAGPQQGAGPVQGGGPLQGTGPLQGAASPLSGGAAPLQGAALLQNVGPLQGASPIQATLIPAAGPATAPTGLPGVLAPPAPGAPGPALAAGLPAPAGPLAGNVQTINQLLGQLMAGPNAPNAPALVALVNALAPPTPAPAATPALAPPTPPPPTPVSAPQVSAPSINTPQPPTVLPPPSYDTTKQSQVSQQ